MQAPNISHTQASSVHTPIDDLARAKATLFNRILPLT